MFIINHGISFPCMFCELKETKSPSTDFHFCFLFTKSISIQDLPNYAQQTVPIFSLPQEWLWCESWCGNATKSKAKTIDLCNNPMTKEPKLQVNMNFWASCYKPSTTWTMVMITDLCPINLFIFLIFSKGARRIVAEWPDLDFEARSFTAKILGEEVDTQERVVSPIETQSSVSDSESEDKSELWIRFSISI